MRKIVDFIKKETVLSAALLLAVVSMFFVHPDREYAAYVDYRTLALLFCLMAVMAGYRKTGVFGRLAETLLGKVSGSRPVAAILILLCFFTSMIITNDVALITFVPFTITVLKMAKGQQYMVPVVVLQTVAANLGSMLTPIGNPQNLYLYSCANMGLMEFLLLMLPYTAISLVLLLVALFMVKQKKMDVVLGESEEKEKQQGRQIVVYTVLFGLCIASVARWLPWQLLFVLIVAAILLVDKSVFKQIDYSLLLTFIGFFIFIGNMGRIEVIRTWIAQMVEGREVLTSILASQVISNVPAALLLSGFTQQWELLVIGTNLGGLGTLIASMASLISFKYVAKEAPERKKNYIGSFTVVNVVFLLILYGFSLL